MTITSKTPSEQALITLKALQDAVTKVLKRKKKLGHYVVTWQNGKPVQIGADAQQQVN